MVQNKHSFEEFEPYSKWKKEEHQDTVEIHLPDFKKDELKIQVNSSLGQLTIKGEHKVDATKSIFFNKTINVPKECKSDDIIAKFSGRILHVTIKKQALPSTQQIQDGKPNQLQTGYASSAREASRETSTANPGDVTVIRVLHESCLKLGGNKRRTLVYVTLAVAIVAYVTKLLRSFHVYDCTCIAFKYPYANCENKS